MNRQFTPQRILGTVFLLLSVLSTSCASSSKNGARKAASPPSQAPAKTFGQETTTRTSPIHYRFRAVDGREISDVLHVDKPKLLLFITSYDWASQTQARYVKKALSRLSGKVETVVFFLERPDDAPLASIYMKTVGLDCPAVVISPEALMKTELSMIHSVPTTVLLDRGSRVVWIARGVVPNEKIATQIGKLFR